MIKSSLQIQDSIIYLGKPPSSVAGDISEYSYYLMSLKNESLNFAATQRPLNQITQHGMKPDKPDALCQSIPLVFCHLVNNNYLCNSAYKLVLQNKETRIFCLLILYAFRVSNS